MGRYICDLGMSGSCCLCWRMGLVAMGTYRPYLPYKRPWSFAHNCAIQAAIPVYGAYAAYTTATGMRSSMDGLGGAANDMSAPSSKRQVKMEKRQTEGKNVKYR